MMLSGYCYFSIKPVSIRFLGKEMFPEVMPSACRCVCQLLASKDQRAVRFKDERLQMAGGWLVVDFSDVFYESKLEGTCHCSSPLITGRILLTTQRMVGDQ